MKIEPATAENVFDVASVMRERDYDEFSCVSFTRDRNELAVLLASRYGNRPDVLCGFWQGWPTCIGGTLETRPGVVTLLFFATDDFPKIGLGITRFIRQRLFPRLEAGGIHRIEAVSKADYTHTHAWLRTIGLEPETGPMKGYGRDGSAYIQFSRVRDAGPAGA